jgi:hypothetical protein
MRAAFWAGKTPKKSPMPIDTDRPTATVQRETDAGRGVATRTRREMPNPMTTPMTPPSPVRTMASKRNCRRMSRERAPMALRIPISRVRSLT